MTVGNQYFTLTLSNSAFTDPPTVRFDSPTNSALIVNDGANCNIVYSYNGRDVEGEIRPGENVRIRDLNLSRIWLKTTAPGAVRVYSNVFGDVEILKQGFSSASCRLFGTDDLSRVFTWAEIDGVRRVTKIVFTSASLDTELGQTVVLERIFSYQAADPFDLVSIVDGLTIS